MSGRDALQALHSRWARLSAIPTDDTDTARSLIYFTAETGIGTHKVPVPRRVSNWVELLLELEQFVERTEELPRRNSRRQRDVVDPLVEKLANWVRYQRHSELTLCTYQRERLEYVRCFSWAPAEDAWDDQLDLLMGFVETHAGFPSARAANFDERRRARWVRHQVARHRRGALEKHRVDELSAVNGWRW